MEAFQEEIKEIEGVLVPSVFPTENIISAMRYKPDDDIIVTSYPKTGSNWTQYLIYLILNKGEPCESYEEFKKNFAFLEKDGGDMIKNLNKPRIIMSHLPFNKIPKSDKAKYIYVVRNPKDVLVSYYYFCNFMVETQLTFNQFFDRFIDGNIFWGDYFEHVKEWYKHRDEPNVLMISYEEMKTDTKKIVLQLAKFLGNDHEKALLDDSNILEAIVKNSSVEECKKVMQMEKMLKPEEIEDINVSEGQQNFTFVRKGIIGDWKTHLSSEQNEIINEKANKTLSGIDYYDLWKKMGIFV
ncbi:hypothetical protein LAZ67_6001702 [Cordylochernes scorpioides]|uniref:Sulfotransferase domain-containing protein n=1 Tax=Cordylochernes scorpioides TaxID=51811 RepID=A0ABY6KJB1_9ARAC|nr:hypothetical protein LAZ67_6001702 [Cordylochernes scorpioides]